jgi:hypothetical protein
MGEHLKPSKILRSQGMDWTSHAEGSEQWLAFVKTVINLQATSKAGNFFTD